MNVILYRGGVITTAITADQQPPDALLIADGAIVWIGASDDLESLPELAQDAEVIELDGALVTPVFHEAYADVLQVGRAALQRAETEAVQSFEDELHAGLTAVAKAGVGVLNHHDTTRGTVAELEKIAQKTATAASGYPQCFAFGAGELADEAQARQILAQAPSLSGFGPVILDGAFSSHQAALHERYTDRTAPQWSGDDPGLGELYLTREELVTHLIIATKLGRPAVFSARGDRAIDMLGAAFEEAANEVGADALRSVRHQLVGGELINAAALASLVLFGVVVIADAQVETELGALEGLYDRRLGPVRSIAMNPWADLITSGVEILFSSFASGPRNPWATVHAALTHPDRGQQLSIIDAFGAHTGGNISLEVGDNATFAIWEPTTIDLYPLRSARGLGQITALLPLPSREVLAGANTNGLLRCRALLREGVALI